MKKYSVLFLLIIHFSLFGMKSSGESSVSFFLAMPCEIQGEVLYKILISSDDLLYCVVKLQIVCHSWKNLVLNDKGNILPLINEAKEKNKQFCEVFSDYHLNEVEGYCAASETNNYEFIDTNVFALSKAWPFIELSIFDLDCSLFQKLIQKNSAFLNKLFLDFKCTKKIIRNVSTCTCNDDNNKCVPTKTCMKENQKKILDIIILNENFLSGESRCNFFNAIVNNGLQSYCILRYVLPILRVDESDNANYYFEYILNKMSKIMLNMEDDENLRIVKLISDQKKCLDTYLSFLSENNADLSFFSTEAGQNMVQALNNQLDGHHFPRIKDILNNQVKK